MRRGTPPSVAQLLIGLVLVGLLIILLSNPLTIAQLVIDVVVAAVLIALISWFVP